MILEVTTGQLRGRRVRVKADEVESERGVGRLLGAVDLCGRPQLPTDFACKDYRLPLDEATNAEFLLPELSRDLHSRVGVGDLPITTAAQETAALFIAPATWSVSQGVCLFFTDIDLFPSQCLLI